MFHAAARECAQPMQQFEQALVKYQGGSEASHESQKPFHAVFLQVQ
jgi:hypothetical protein